MPKHKNKQRWNTWNSGFQRNNRQNQDNTYQNDHMNMGQNYYNNSYFDSSFQHNMAQNYSNNFYNPSSQNNMAQNDYSSYFYPNYSHGNFSSNFMQNDQQDSFRFTQNGHKAMRQSNRNNDVQRCTIRNVRSNNFNSETNASISSGLNRSCQGNMQHNVINNTNDIEIDITGDCIHQKPCNTESEYQRLNGHKLSKETKLKARIDNYSIKTQLYNEKGYIIKESLYKNPELIQDLSDNNNEETNSNETNVEWTCTFWKKHNGSSIPDTSRPSQKIGKVSKKNQNRLEKSLNKMLAKPAEMSKGISLLQKMGWTGGGLGRDGDGIVEPIAPKATYAVKTIGLGHLTEKTEKPKKCKPFSQINKHQLKSAEFQNNFCMNLLLYVLEFVKNDEQNKIVFEPRLTKMERKRIHDFIGKIRECSDLDDFDDRHLTPKHFALIKDIWVHNCYELWTESEGEGQDRRLCLYKEAPAHVYLVTPEDLALKAENEPNDDSDENNVQDTKILHVTGVKDEIQTKIEQNNKDFYEETCPKIKTENDENINMCDEINNKIEHNLESECVTDEKDSIVDKNKLRNDTKIHLCDEIERKMEINDQTIKTDVQNCIVKEIKLETQEDVTETLTNEEDTNILGKIKIENNKNVNFVEGMDLNKKAIGKFKSENDKEIDVNEKSIKSGENESISGKIVKYFKEFLQDDVFKEFRFLGPFSDDELMNINLFFDICLELDDGRSEEKDELLKLFGDDSLEVLEDNNGKRFIHKKEENQEPPQREDSSDSVICLD